MVVSMIKFVVNAAFIWRFAMNYLVLIGNSITNYNKYNEYHYNPAANKSQCTFVLLLFRVFSSKHLYKLFEI